MPYENQLNFIKQLYRNNQINIADNGRIIPLNDRFTERLQRYDPLYGITDRTLQEQERMFQTAMEAMLRIRAEEDIRRAWNAVGGASSSVGLPKTGDIHVSRNGEDWEAAFRSGTITIKHHEGRRVKRTIRQLTVDFVGLECNVRQEKTDELFGVVAVIGPANQQISTFSFPGGDGTISLGPENMRIWNTFHNLYTGPVEDIILVATLIEHDDFADVEGVARNIANKIVEKGAALLGGLTGLPAESVTDETWFRDGLAEVIGFVMGDIFGMGDDPYTAQSKKIPWTEIGDWGPHPQLPHRRQDDPKTIDRWTHKIKVTGHDDANDYGDYDFYFNLSVKQIDTEETI